MKTASLRLGTYLLLSLSFTAPAATYYVDANNLAPLSPYTTWATAATNIQDAVDTAAAGDEILVTNGVYRTGARDVNGMSRVAVTKAVMVRSVNGPAVTSIVGFRLAGNTNGDSGIRCVYLTNGAVLTGFTLTNGTTSYYGCESCWRLVSGGGIFCESSSAVVSNCVLRGNAAGSGGGVLGGTVNNCTLADNWASSQGGGACSSALNGCTLTHNAAAGGGGVYSGTLSDCALAANSASQQGGGAYAATLNNCSLATNSAPQGGGAHSATLTNCTLTGNSASSSGGASAYSTLYNCTLTGNAANLGGGTYYGNLNNCQLTGNRASSFGGGIYGGEHDNCLILSNSAVNYGGGAYRDAYSGTLNNCTLVGNSADAGGGAYNTTLNNCTLTGNSARIGGGICSGTAGNCIIYYNSGGNQIGAFSYYCCTTPMPLSGNGNMTAEPQLASSSHLSATSPCRGRGSPAYSSGLDIDGEPWADPPDIGCDQFSSGSSTGALSVAIVASYTNVAVGYQVDLQALITGQANDSSWNFGDGVVVSNLPYASHAWSAVGDYVVELRAYNDSYPAGVATNLLVHVEAPVHYVALDSPASVPPYDSWATAATNIQQAVDAATLPGALVLVSNGVYQSGAVAVSGMSNRVAVTRAVRVQSVNGPGVTLIVGSQVPGSTNGSSAVRCVYLVNGAVLSGFTLINGATGNSGDYTNRQSGGAVWCQSPSAFVSNCVLAGNAAAYAAGGAWSGTLLDCTLTGNSAGTNGGGVCHGTLSNCTLTLNTASSGAGAYGGSLNNCQLTGNRACFNGGGTYGGQHNNCLVLSNSAASSGGGAYSGTLNNCTLVGNSADLGGGAHNSTLNNCLVYYNTANYGANYPATAYAGSVCTFNYSCTTPLPAGPGNLNADPQLAGAWRLSPGSPCRGGGGPAYAGGVDLDGEPWANPPDIGCDQYTPGSLTGSLSAAIVASYTNVAVGFPVDFQAQIDGRVSASRWSFSDGLVLSNTPSASHAWPTPGDYTVELRAYNESQPDGVPATATIHVVPQPVHYVATNSPWPVWPFSSWANAATRIQDAVSAATVPGALVLVSNGVYRGVVSVTKPLRLCGANGPAVTTIGGWTNIHTRCVYLTSGAVLAGFTLTSGTAYPSSEPTRDLSGGGVWCESASAVVSNCVLAGNSAPQDSGGGARGGTLINCTLTGNSAGLYGGGTVRSTLINCVLTGSNSAWNGGGASLSVLHNCLVTSNSAYGSGGGLAYATADNCMLSGNCGTNGGGGAGSSMLNNCTVVGNSTGSWGYGGGVSSGTYNNCIVYYNSGYGDANYTSGSAFSHCCTTPLPYVGSNFTNEPLFLDLAGGNLRLQSNSPCINAGLNAYTSGLTDLDGNPRIVGGTVDVGAYEFQPDRNGFFLAWLQQYGLARDGSADYADSDHDGHNNWQEWRAGTNPTNAASVFRLQHVDASPGVATLAWTSATNRTYSVERSDTLAPSTAFVAVQTNLPGSPDTTTWTDPNPPAPGPAFYRVRIEP